MDLDGLRAAGAVVKETLDAMQAAVRPGITTAELDAVAAEVFSRRGARSAPTLDYDFPGTTCISVNEEAVHGVPGPRRLEEGDLVKLDVTAELNGWYADACRTAFVGQPSAAAVRLVEAAEKALERALVTATAGAPLNAIGASVERTVQARGFSVCEALSGHGIGRRIHEPPDVPNYYDPDLVEPLEEGTVMTIEPIIAAGDGEVVEESDGWTVRTADRSLSAHAEHTIVVTRGAPIVLTG
ncbi:MAG: methionyl aminopeptidase [Thermoleophilaceae bacterium]|nr:methionyl aminopeptidase [Thermoleophilaceae bacterium]